MEEYQKILLNAFIDKFENSKCYTNDNKRTQKISLKISKMFPKYLDETDYSTFNAINQELKYLNFKEYIFLKLSSGEMVDTATLNVSKLEDIYKYLDRIPKKDMYLKIKTLLDEFSNRNIILSKYCNDLYIKLNNNRLKYSNEYISQLKNEFIALDEILKLEKETFYRDFSIRVFKNSKIFENISSSIASILYKYTDYPNQDTILAYFNLVKNPTYVFFKGNATIKFRTQSIELSQFSSDIGISIAILEDIIDIKVHGSKVITIENLTSFNTYPKNNDFVIYLGGFHNQVRREFIKKIYSNNKDKQYLHFGDIDAGGFYILEHLRNKTGIDFIPYKMDIQTLKEYSEYTQSLTNNDIIRLNNFLDTKYKNVILYMLSNNCKLEQEAITIL